MKEHIVTASDMYIFRSRLGCQIVLTKDLDGLEVTVPVGLADARGWQLLYGDYNTVCYSE